MDASRGLKPTAGTKPEIAGRLRSIAKIVIIDVAAPLIAYSLLRSAGMSTVTALVLSGVFPALGVATGVIQHRRLDVVGALVLAGILVGTVLGLIGHSARLVLMEGSAPTAIFGVACAQVALVPGPWLAAELGRADRHEAVLAQHLLGGDVVMPGRRLEQQA